MYVRSCPVRIFPPRMSPHTPPNNLLTTGCVTGNVWHGSQEPWHNWDILAGRFVSEFGMYVVQT